MTYLQVSPDTLKRYRAEQEALRNVYTCFSPAKLRKYVNNLICLVAVLPTPTRLYGERTSTA